MSVATRILFNSPALHSLKRDQLVKLCKIHSLKANGKNKDLIGRLQQHAQTLPPDEPLSIATRSDNLDARETLDSEGEGSGTGSDCMGTPGGSSALPRPSEQWEMVMDSISGADEEALRSNRGGNSNLQAGEFGTDAAKASSVTSSLKAIASSLGLKRNTTTDTSSSSLSAKETHPLSAADLDSATQDLPPVDPIPGQLNLRGMPAPANARLSITESPTTTTIRLVSGGNPPSNVFSPPKLKPFTTTFDLFHGTPKPSDAGHSSVSVWPISPGDAQIQNIYPSLDAFRDILQQETKQPDLNDCSDMDIDIAGGFGPPPNIPESTPKRRSARLGRPNTDATPKSTEKSSLDPVDIFSPAPKPQRASARSRVTKEPFVFGSVTAVPPAKRVPSGGTASGHPTTPSTTSRATLAPPTSSRTSRSPIPLFPSATTGAKGNHSRNVPMTGTSLLGVKARTSGSISIVSSLGTRTSIRGAAANNHANAPGSIAKSRLSSTLMAPTASSLAKAASLTRVHGTPRAENESSTKTGASNAHASPRPSPLSPPLGQITNDPRSPLSLRPPFGKVFSQPPSLAFIRPPMSLTAAAETVVKPSPAVSSGAKPVESKPPISPKPKVLPGRRPRISRSKVIARLASQQEAEGTKAAAARATTDTAGTSTSSAHGKTRSSMGVGVAGDRRHGSGSKAEDVLMSARRRARQTEYARRRSRAVASEDEARSMAVD